MKKIENKRYILENTIYTRSEIKMNIFFNTNKSFRNTVMSAWIALSLIAKEILLKNCAIE